MPGAHARQDRFPAGRAAGALFRQDDSALGQRRQRLDQRPLAPGRDGGGLPALPRGSAGGQGRARAPGRAPHAEDRALHRHADALPRARLPALRPAALDPAAPGVRHSRGRAEPRGGGEGFARGRGRHVDRHGRLCAGRPLPGGVPFADDLAADGFRRGGLEALGARQGARPRRARRRGYCQDRSARRGPGARHRRASPAAARPQGGPAYRRHLGALAQHPQAHPGAGERRGRGNARIAAAGERARPDSGVEAPAQALVRGRPAAPAGQARAAGKGGARLRHDRNPFFRERWKDLRAARQDARAHADGEAGHRSVRARHRAHPEPHGGRSQLHRGAMGGG